MINTLHTQHASNNSTLGQFHWLVVLIDTPNKPLKGKPAKTSPFTCNILLRKQLTNLLIWRFYPESFPPFFLRQNISQSLPSCSFSSYSCNPYQHENDVRHFLPCQQKDSVSRQTSCSNEFKSQSRSHRWVASTDFKFLSVKCCSH